MTRNKTLYARHFRVETVTTIVSIHALRYARENFLGGSRLANHPVRETVNACTGASLSCRCRGAFCPRASHVLTGSLVSPGVAGFSSVLTSRDRFCSRRATLRLARSRDGFSSDSIFLIFFSCEISDHVSLHEETFDTRTKTQINLIKISLGNGGR